VTAPLTRKQAALLAFIREFRATHDNRSPTVDEIREGMGFKSKGSVHGALKRMRARGAITWKTHVANSIQLVPENAVRLDIPSDMMGHINHLASIAGVSADAVILEAIRDGLSAYSKSAPKVSRDGKIGRAHV